MKSSCRWGGAGGAALNKEQLPMGRGERSVLHVAKVALRFVEGHAQH